ncbi:YgaP family membrane protein [Candidatus Thioglobus sp.]|uniref:YgaP family membrane protein n=1 Tax=Candidatus Thioglobus sp. TaxID=2026721 RepID=UPI003D0EF919
MKKNVGGIDRALRIAVGATLVAYALYSGAVWAWIGLIPLATGLIGWCAFYPIIGCSSCQKK